ncbi:outer membrane beta-barrel protein [Maribellus comscasis]|uniref:Outer membrane beta-barrel protein n=1 Tax=Maribellus comscasis TaxID=2681766 RepID=A0A6I6JVV9_9BACT|nr:outer membrane beta-barrel protein [Maribellus comscasis]QGY44217.1 outer membrane beta-barrel protein [Maribellus comscasis]
MKQLVTVILCSVIAMNAFAQRDTTEVKMLKKNVVTVVENEDGTKVKVGNDRGVEVITDDWGDTTHIRIGRRTFDVVDNWNGTHVNVSKEPREKHWSGSFNPHWAGIEVGMNMFYDTDYSLYGGDEFFDLIPGKSLTWNFNFAEWAFKNEKNNFGLVTGLGFSFSDYTFDRAITIEKENGDGMIVPVPLDPDGLKKSKLTMSYLTAPLMFEIKTPLRMGGSRLYLAGGVIGGINIGSHTKYKYRKDKEKLRSNFNINTFKYELTGRIGFGDLCIFANYSMTPLFSDGKGPELYPLMIGISFPNI